MPLSVGLLTVVVSIPSRRVGDSKQFKGGGLFAISFHPLKAGRRLEKPNFCPCVLSLFPSPQGGSETITDQDRKTLSQQQFPSPQGGSETKGK